MTTLLPGASEVLTHGFTVRPRSTACLASSAAAIITDGLEVLVHEVIDAIATCPWSSSASVPSPMVSGTRLVARPCAGTVAAGDGAAGAPPPEVGGSLAGNDSALASSTPLRIP